MLTVEWKFLRFALLSGSLPVFCAGALISSPAHAMTEQEYHEALKVAQAKVERTRAATSPSALSSSIIKAYYGRYYKVGDSWDVAAWEFKSPQAYLASPSESKTRKTGRGGIFHYEVKEVRNGATPQVVISVKQISDFGMAPVDPLMEELTLTMTDRVKQTEKTYKFKGRNDLVKVSPNGLHSRITPLELFPLDVPDIETALRNPVHAMPELPPVVQDLGRRASYKPDLTQSTWLEQDDFFGRPVQILWQYGNPWPSYLKTDNGIAILIRARSS